MSDKDIQFLIDALNQYFIVNGIPKKAGIYKTAVEQAEEIIGENID